MEERTTEMQKKTDTIHNLASAGAVLTDSELDGLVKSLQSIDKKNVVDLARFRDFLKQCAHLSHKDWARTDSNSRKLGENILHGWQPHLFTRILRDGNWRGAVANKPQNLPWVVLVTGLNGIRKTTSLYQDWWPELLYEALGESSPSYKDLPSGQNSFFRQLDHMIVTLCNQEFRELYATAADDVTIYSERKAALFARYRTISEILGIYLLRQAQEESISCMLETSGKDVAMFEYVDTFFSSDEYRKLVLHFKINDIEFAKMSVDNRMRDEMERGRRVVAAAESSTNVDEIINVNQGGPYGSSVLAAVQTASDRVWETEIKTGRVGSSWYKAEIMIRADRDSAWTAQAVKPDGQLGTEFVFKKL